MNIFNPGYSLEEYEFQTTGSRWVQETEAYTPKLPVGFGWVLISWAASNNDNQYLWARKIETTPYRG